MNPGSDGKSPESLFGLLTQPLLWLSALLHKRPASAGFLSLHGDTLSSPQKNKYHNGLNRIFTAPMSCLEERIPSPPPQKYPINVLNAVLTTMRDNGVLPIRLNMLIYAPTINSFDRHSWPHFIC